MLEFGLKLCNFGLKLLLKPDVNKMANIYVSGTAAITAEVLPNCQMQWGMLIEFRECPLLFTIRHLLPLHKAH